MAKKFWVVKETKKDRQKRKERRLEREGNIRTEAYNVGLQEGIDRTRAEMAAVLFTVLCREPGQVKAEIEVESSLIGQIGIHRRTLRRGQLAYDVYTRDLEP